MVIKKTKGLGKGLGALLPGDIIPGQEGRTVLELGINELNPNENQPRKLFDDEKLRDLAESIKENGVIQPIIVTKQDGAYRIVAGERRWRASRLAGKKTIPAIVKELSDKEMLQQALIENIQRQDLNALEEANALERLLKEYQMTQDALSKVVGRSRSAVANTLRLLNLPGRIQKLLEEEALSAGHARALLALPDEGLQIKAAERIIDEEMSVRASEKMIKHWLNPSRKTAVRQEDPQYLLSIKSVEKELSEYLGTKVLLKDKRGKGSVVIEYYSSEDLERLLELIR